jgi:hypothetical protein
VSQSDSRPFGWIDENEFTGLNALEIATLVVARSFFAEGVSNPTVLSISDRSGVSLKRTQSILDSLRVKGLLA